MTTEFLLGSGLYERRRGVVYSKYYPQSNFRVPAAEPSVNVAIDNESEEESEGSTANESETFGLTMRGRAISLRVGSLSDLALAKRATYRRTRPDYDTGYAFHGLKQHLLIPDLKTYVVDDHHLLYYVLCEASTLGLIDASRCVLLNFDAHHDIAPINVLPPGPESGLAAQSSYTVTHLRLGTHLSAILRGGLAERVIWFTNEEELELKSTDMDQELTGNKDRFDIKFLDETADGFLSPIPPERLAVSLDWDFLSARYHEGLVLEDVTNSMVDEFLGQLRRIGLRKDSYGLFFICSSPAYTEESTVIPGIRHFLEGLATL